MGWHWDTANSSRRSLLIIRIMHTIDLKDASFGELSDQLTAASRGESLRSEVRVQEPPQPHKALWFRGVYPL